MARDLNPNQAGSFRQHDVNDPSVRHIRGKNYFPQSFGHASTCRYGEVDPIMSMRCERGDTVPYKFSTDLNTYTMASPVKSRVNLHSAAYRVPMQAIYPRNWKDIMFPIPSKGDDSPTATDSVSSETVDACRALLDVMKLSSALCGLVETYGVDSVDTLNVTLRSIFLLEAIHSSGSLFAKFNMHFDGAVFTDDNGFHGSFDKWFDTVFIPIFQEFLDENVSEDTGSSITIKPILVDSDGNSVYYGTLEGSSSTRRILELLRTGEWSIGSGLSYTAFAEGFGNPRATISSWRLVNIEPIVAYQLVCAHFFVNSKIDFVYTAQLYRDNMESILRGLGSASLPSFEWNGITKLYDVFSYHNFTSIISVLSTGTAADSITRCLDFLFNLFSIKRSLRFGDYFTGARSEPIAVGDTDVPVTDGSVATLTLTRKMQLTRLLQKVNIVRSRFADYLTGIFGGVLPEAPDDVPVRLSQESMPVDGFEVNNTGSGQLEKTAGAVGSQNITTTNLRLQDSRYMFEVTIEQPCWLIAVQWFDTPRFYSRTFDKFSFHYDRYDDFLPDMQFIGDQAITNDELKGVRSGVFSPFAYQLRNMEYKVRYNYVSGGFVEQLPTWLMVTDNSDGNEPLGYITPEYIRSSPSEFDRFYKSVTGYSLGSYFHFMYVVTNILDPYRQMVYTPEILA